MADCCIESSISKVSTRGAYLPKWDHHPFLSFTATAFRHTAFQQHLLWKTALVSAPQTLLSPRLLPSSTTTLSAHITLLQPLLSQGISSASSSIALRGLLQVCRGHNCQQLHSTAPQIIPKQPFSLTPSKGHPAPWPPQSSITF